MDRKVCPTATISFHMKSGEPLCIYRFCLISVFFLTALLRPGGLSSGERWDAIT